jgi:uncharacterized protein YcfL
MKKMLTIMALSLSFVGCASIVSGTSQSVQIKAVDTETNKPIKGATCIITTSKGMTFNVEQNPGMTTLNKSEGNLTVKCKAKGYEQKQIGVASSFDAWTIGNIIFWPGVIIDVVDGAYLEYPSFVTVTMAPVTAKA